MKDLLPERVTKSEAIKSIETRADFNRLTHSLQRFSRRGAEKPVSSTRGAKSTQWEVDEFKIKQRVENARRTRERKRLGEEEVSVGGKKTGVKRKEMGRIKENELNKHKLKFDNMSQKEWELAKQRMDKRFNAQYRDEKKELLRTNYIKAMVELNYPDSLIDLVKQVDIDKFITTYNTDETATIDFIYDPIEMQLKIEQVRNTWTNALAGDI